jgi:hypothetical protein
MAAALHQILHQLRCTLGVVLLLSFPEIISARSDDAAPTERWANARSPSVPNLCMWWVGLSQAQEEKYQRDRRGRR